MNFKTLLVPGIALAVALAPTASAQTTVSINPDLDNTLFEDLSGGFSNALGPLFVGRTAGGVGPVRRMLVRWDVAGNVPAGARIIEAELEFTITNSIASTPSVLDVHRVTADWGEGTTNVGYGGGAGGGGGFGAPATANDATWLHSFFPGTFWMNPGGDFAPMESFKMVMPPNGTMIKESEQALVDDVQDMLDSPADNYGWLFKVDETEQVSARRFDSRDAGASNPPVLRITYLLQAETGKIGVGCPTSGGTFDVEFLGAAIGGQTVTIDREAAFQSSIGADFFSLYLDPVGVPLQPGCTVYLPLAQELIPGSVFLSGTGASQSPFAVPAGFPGFLISCQSVVLDNSLLGLSLSNAAVMILQ